MLRREHPHSRLADGRWISAAIGAFKDESVLRKRRGTGKGGKGDEKGKNKEGTGDS